MDMTFLAYHEIRNRSFIKMHADVSSQTPQCVTLVLANGAYERSDAIVVVQVLLSSRCARADHPAHRTFPTVCHLTLMMVIFAVKVHL